MAMREHFEILVGSRVACEGHRGTVLYVGNVPPTEGVWLGVEWDNPERGKHDGSHEAVRYFQTRHPKSGSFVRPNKVSTGRDFVTALKERYGEVNDQMAGIDVEEVEDLKRRTNAPFIEMVGFEKVNKIQSQFDKLTVVCLKNELVNGPGKPGDIEKLCPNVHTLDLSKNLISSWKAVSDIAVQLKHLRHLDVSRNMLQLLEYPEDHAQSFAALKYLLATSVGYNWTQFLHCAIMWPQIEYLKIPDNNITTLSTPPKYIFYNLKDLDLEGNPIKDGKELNKLGGITSLEYLNISRTGITSLQFPSSSAEEKTALFPSLKHLNVCDNQIETWESVNELNKLHSLTELRIQNNPLLKTDRWDNIWQIIIAKIGKLKILNGEFITDERKGAEYYYLKKYGLEWLKLNSQNNKNNYMADKLLNDFIDDHPRYPALIDKYGAPEEAEVKITSNDILSKMITVQLVNPFNESDTQFKTLPKSTAVMTLCIYFRVTYKLGAGFPKLGYISADRPDIAIPLEDTSKDLHYYSVQDGDKIILLK